MGVSSVLREMKAGISEVNTPKPNKQKEGK